MIPEDVKDVCQMLLERSKRKEVNWTFGSPRGPEDEDYLVNLPNSSFNIWQAEDCIRCSILNSGGQIVLQFSDEGNLADAELLGELLQWAKRIVFNVDEAVQDLRCALKAPQPVGKVPETKKDNDDLPF